MEKDFVLDGDLFRRLAAARTPREVIEILQLTDRELDVLRDPDQGWSDEEQIAIADLIRAMPSDDASVESPFDEHADTIQGAIRFVARRYRLSPADTEEFRSFAFAKVIEHDYRRLRKYEGRQEASFETYLVAVLSNLCLDYQITLRGKFRPSAAARRLGRSEAILIERLRREGWSTDEIWTHIANNYGTQLTRPEFDAMTDQLPLHVSTRVESDELLEEVAAGGGAPDDAYEDSTRLMWMRRVIAAAGEGLRDDDRLILVLLFEEGLSIAQVARVTNVKYQQLYQRVQDLYAAIRRDLEARGVGRDTIREWLKQ